ncbi:MAG: TIR domain-containing protein [Ruminococcus sp.]|nr:TIR domain-containing protein [Ruminococcus sp.]
MAILKCKMCGGDLNIQDGMTVAECEYCGTRQTVPTADNEKKMTLFARANRLRAACEFDKAAGVYESIVAEFPEEAEAYWGLILCKYGIEYVDDPATGKKIPTCHRSSFDSIMDDSDFEQVMENADPISRRVYRDEAKAIEELRKNIIEVSSKEEPYDIFICYKETDENGNRTVDSVIAQDIYKALTDEDYRVFFSRITLEDKLGQEYEPYIFSALNSAKVMLAVGTDYEYYNAVWVKNEWSRFLALIAKGEKKTLIPCYKDIDAYDIPREFKHLQAQDMGKVGAMQDLLRGVGKILGSKKQNNPIVNVAADSNVSAMIQRGNMALEDGDFQDAVGFFERALDSNPKAAHAYLGKFLAFHRMTSLHDLQDKVCALDNDKEFKRAEQFANPELANELKEVRESNELKIQRLRFLDAIRKGLKQVEIKEKRAAEIEEKYIKACSLQDLADEDQLVTAIEMFKALKNYKDSAERLTECERSYKEKKTKRKAREKKEKEDTIKRLGEIRSKTAPYRNRIAAGYGTTFGVNEEGKVVAVGDNKNGECSVSGWSDIVAVSSSFCHTIGLKSNGTVVAAGIELRRRYKGNIVTSGELKISDWKNIVAIFSSSHHTLGLKSDGTVIATGQCDVTDWKDIVAITAEEETTIGLKSNGKVEVAGHHRSEEILKWNDMVSVSSGDNYTVGLKSNGTVVAIGSYKERGHYSFKKWNDLVADWKDIVAIAAGNKYIVGLKSDGTVITTGYIGDREFYYGQCDVSNWKDIVAIAAGDHHTIGLKSDGTLIAIGKNENGQCNVSGWKLFKSEAEKEADYVAASHWKETGTIEALERAINTFKSLKSYKDSIDRVVECERAYGVKVRNKRITDLNNEKNTLQTELTNLKGLFTGKRRKKIEARLAEIETELKKL